MTKRTREHNKHCPNFKASIPYCMGQSQSHTHCSSFKISVALKFQHKCFSRVSPEAEKSIISAVEWVALLFHI